MKPTEPNYFPHCPVPIHLVGASTKEQNEFYRDVFQDTLNNLYPVEPVDDGWYGWTSDVAQPLPYDAPDYLNHLYPAGWRPCFDINFMLKDGDWGWDETNEILHGWEVLIVAESVEWVKRDGVAVWEMVATHKELCKAKARKLPDQTWEVEIISEPLDKPTD